MSLHPTMPALCTLAAEANAAHAVIEQLAGRALEKAREAGAALRQAKQLVPHGGWGEWVRDNFRGSPRTAQLYMRIADRWPEIEANPQRVAEMSLRQATALLEAPRERVQAPQPEPETMRLVQHPAVRGLVPQPSESPAYPGLVASIRDTGLLKPIYVDQHGRIIDGWLRYHACREAGVDVQIEVRRIADDSEALSLWVSCNLMRQSLTEGQQAAVWVGLQQLEQEMDAATADLDAAAGAYDWEGPYSADALQGAQEIVDLATTAVDSASLFESTCRKLSSW